MTNRRRPIDARKLVQQYEAGLTIAEIGKLVDRTPCAVYQRLRAQGIVFRGNGGAVVRRTPLKPGKPLTRRAELKAKSGTGLKRTGTTKSRKASASTIIPDDVKDAIADRDQLEGHPQCQRCGRLIGTGLFSRHHRDPRGMGGSKADPHAMANLVLLCGTATSRGGCHAEVEGNRAQARIDGWLVPDGIRADEWPARRFGRLDYQMPGATGWEPHEQHPLQAMLEAAA